MAKSTHFSLNVFEFHFVLTLVPLGEQSLFRKERVDWGVWADFETRISGDAEQNRWESLVRTVAVSERGISLPDRIASGIFFSCT